MAFIPGCWFEVFCIKLNAQVDPYVLYVAPHAAHIPRSGARAPQVRGIYLDSDVFVVSANMSEFRVQSSLCQNNTRQANQACPPET